MWLIGQAVKTPPFHGGNRGSIPLWVTIYPGTIAQLGEHLPYKQGVTGSSPVNPTSKTFSEYSLKVFLYLFIIYTILKKRHFL